MNLFDLFEDIEKADPEFTDRISPRRDAIKNMTGFGTKIAVAALPFALSSLLQKAYGQSAPAGVVTALTFALKLEYFESAFYRVGLSSSTLISAADKPMLTAIGAHEAQHVTFLRSALGVTTAAPADSSYDFTAKGNFADVMTNYETFLKVAQVLEDTGVRAYKGQAGALLGSQTYLTAALNIHSVEARHAAAIRYLRRLNHGATTTKPWITGTGAVANDTGISAVDGNYAGENTSVQAGVDITKLPGVSGNVSITAAIEAFDEPLTMAQVLTLVAPFNVS